MIGAYLFTEMTMQIYNYLRQWAMMLFSGYALLGLSGCQSTPEGYMIESTSHVDTFFVKGRLIVIMPQERFSATMTWDEHPSKSHIHLYGPTGITRMRLEATSDHSTLWINGTQHHADNPAQLLQRTTGWTLPFESMKQWMKGLPAAGDAHITYDELGRLKAFHQDKIQYGRSPSQHGNAALVQMCHAQFKSKTHR